MQSITRSIFSMVIVGVVTLSHAMMADTSKCSPCQLKKSLQEALAQSIKDAQMAALAAGGAFVKASELDEEYADIDDIVEYALELEDEYADVAQDYIRAPREALADPCNNCGSIAPTASCDNISDQLKALRCCCAAVAHQLARQGKDARKCCKKLRHKIDDVEDLVETLIDQSADCCSVTESLLVSVIDQSAICCSVTESILGDPATASILDIPACLANSIADGIINGTDADVMTWLKSIYDLVYKINNIFVCG